MKDVNVVVGPGSIGQAIARRVSAGKHVVLADLREEHAASAAKTPSEAGFDVSVAQVDISSRASIRALIDQTGPRGAGYRRMIELSAVGRAGTPDEVANVAALLMGPDGAFITGSDFLMDGGVTAAYWYGALAPDATARP